MNCIISINWEQNSTASLFIDQKLVGCVSEERFTRVKNDERYPINAINWLLAEHNIKSIDINAFVFVSKLWGPGYILSRHYTNFTVKDYIEEQNKIWKPRLYDGKNISQIETFKDRLDLNQFPGNQFWKDTINRIKGDSGHVSSEKAKESGQEIRKQVVVNHLGINPEKIYFVDHSLAHSCYAYYTTPFIQRQSKNLILTLDAFGDNINYSASIFENNNSEIKRTIVAEGDNFIIGRLYRYITLILGLKPNEHEYKVMGLAPYCKEEYYQNLVQIFKNIQDVDGLDFVYKNKPKDMYFAIKKLLDGERFDTISGGLQAYTEYLITTWVKNLIQETGIKKISIAGGVAMNVKANMLVAKLKELDYIYIPPSPDDSSQGMGAGYAFMHLNQNIYQDSKCKKLNPYLGRSIEINKNNIINKLNDSDQIQIKDYSPSYIAELLALEKIIARCNSQEEFGARALGNRSILADPRRIQIKKIINEKVKNRDFWMPFACSVLEEYADLYFDLDTDESSYSYMTLCANTTPKGSELIQAAIHPYDETCRPQLVSKSMNPEYYRLIKKFGDLTGVYALLNTSFNLHGHPIVSTENDALDVFLKTKIDVLILGEFVLEKSITK